MDHLLLFEVPLVNTLLNYRTKSLKCGQLYGAIIPSLIAGIIGIWKIIDFKSKIPDLGNNPFAKVIESAVSIEFGLYLVVKAGITLPIIDFLMNDKEAESNEDILNEDV